MKHAATKLLKVSQTLCICMIILIGMIVIQYPAFAASGGANVLFILDGSGSMWGRIKDIDMNEVEKIVVAKKTMSDLVQDLPESFTLGLMVYGHRRKGDCEDIELLSPLGQSDPTTIIKQIQSISPKGKTPITKSIILAGQQLEAIEEETTIVLVSDGEETCEGDPCEYVRTLKQKGIDFTMHVVGFDVNDEQKAQLSCIAEAGGGRYFSAQNAVQLKEAFTEVKKEVVKKVEPQEESKPSGIYTDDFTAGLNREYWKLGTTGSIKNLYTVDDTNHEIRFSKGYGGYYELQNISLGFLREVRGNFDVQIDFRGASIKRIDGKPGNQIWLSVTFGKQHFGVTRSDEPYHGVTDNVHIWADPPGQWFGPRANTATSGTLRITREGTRVTGYFNDTVIYARNYNDRPVVWMGFGLNNHTTKDATSVTFDNFYLSCDKMVPLK